MPSPCLQPLGGPHMRSGSLITSFPSAEPSRASQPHLALPCSGDPPWGAVLQCGGLSSLHGPVLSPRPPPATSSFLAPSPSPSAFIPASGPRLSVNSVRPSLMSSVRSRVQTSLKSSLSFQTTRASTVICFLFSRMFEGCSIHGTSHGRRNTVCAERTPSSETVTVFRPIARKAP